jgi:hypothetical protein
LRNPQAPRAEAVLGEVVSTVDLVLYAGFSRATGAGERSRRLLSVGCVSGTEDERAHVQELIAFGNDGVWHRVGSAAAMPERVRMKLSRVADPARLLDGFDA